MSSEIKSTFTAVLVTEQTTTKATNGITLNPIGHGSHEPIWQRYWKPHVWRYGHANGISHATKRTDSVSADHQANGTKTWVPCNGSSCGIDASGYSRCNNMLTAFRTNRSASSGIDAWSTGRFLSMEPRLGTHDSPAYRRQNNWCSGWLSIPADACTARTRFVRNRNTNSRGKKSQRTRKIWPTPLPLNFYLIARVLNP